MATPSYPLYKCHAIACTCVPALHEWMWVSVSFLIFGGTSHTPDSTRRDLHPANPPLVERRILHVRFRPTRWVRLLSTPTHYSASPLRDPADITTVRARGATGQPSSFCEGRLRPLQFAPSCLGPLGPPAPSCSPRLPGTGHARQ